MKKLSQNGKFLGRAPKKGSEIWMERNGGKNGTGSVSKSVNKTKAKTKVTTRAKTKQAKEQALKIKVIGSSDDYVKDSAKRKRESSSESSSESDYEDESDQTDAVCFFLLNLLIYIINLLYQV